MVAGDRIDEGLLAVCPRLRIVATGSVGFNHIDVAACTARGIAVTNTPDVLNEATADLGWALLMAAARRVCESEHWLRAGQWNRWAWDQFLGADVHGTTLGIVGMGRIGSAIARRARGFSMRILYANRSPSAHEAELGATRVSLDDLLRQSDHVMLVLPYSAQTHHLIGERELGLMKRTAYLINTCRGPVVNEAELIATLNANTIAGAGLDVFDQEPPPADNPLFKMDNVVLTPHLAGPTYENRAKRFRNAFDNVQRVARGQSPFWVIPELKDIVG